MATSTFSKLGNPRATMNPRGRGNPCEACPVRDLSVCAALRAEELELLNAIITRTRFDREQALFYEGDEAKHVFNLTEGTIRLSKMLPDGRRQITGFLSPGDFLGMASSDSYAYTAEAVTGVAVCRFPRAKLEVLFDQFPALERRVLAVASNELRAAQDQMLLLGRKTAREKLATFLHHLTENARRRGESGETLELPMNRTDIADYLGLTTETVSRTFTRMAKEGILELPSTHEVVLGDPERLWDMGEGES